MERHQRLRGLAIDLLYDIVGALIFSIGIHSFIASNKIAPGGFSGLSIVLNYLTGLPIGTLNLILNIPLFLMALKCFGKETTFKTLKTVVIFSVVMDSIVPYLPVYKGDYILAALFGGVCFGTGIAIVYMRGTSTGGTDTASKLIQMKFPFLPIGRLLMLVDLSVLLFGAFVFRNIESLLYGIITIFTSTKTLDSVLYGLDSGKLCLIISEKEEEVAAHLFGKMKRGITYLIGQGAYSGKPKKIILIAVRQPQFYRVKEIVTEIDPKAFIIVTEAGEIFGSGFRSVNSK